MHQNNHRRRKIQIFADAGAQHHSNTLRLGWVKAIPVAAISSEWWGSGAELSPQMFGTCPPVPLIIAAQ